MAEQWLGFGARGEHPGVWLVDIRPDVAGQVEDARALSFTDQRFDGVEFHHVLEHLSPSDGPVALRELWRVLRRGGLLEVSCPDLEACARTLLAGNLDVLLNIYSPHDEPAQLHRWGYTKATLETALHQAGFIDVVPMPITEPHEMRFRARRP